MVLKYILEDISKLNILCTWILHNWPFRLSFVWAIVGWKIHVVLSCNVPFLLTSNCQLSNSFFAITSILMRDQSWITLYIRMYSGISPYSSKKKDLTLFPCHRFDEKPTRHFNYRKPLPTDDHITSMSISTFSHCEDRSLHLLECRPSAPVVFFGG